MSSLSTSTPTPISPVPSTICDSPAVSELSLPRPVDQMHAPLHSTQSPYPAPSPLAQISTATLSPPVTPESTVLSNMPLLQPPQPRSIPQSSVSQPGPQPRERSPPGAPYRLTSPSTTTLLSSTHAVRDALPGPHVHRAPSQRSVTPEPESAVAEVSPSPPPSPYPQSRASTATTSDVFVEDFTWEPHQRWSADRRLGLTLEERVQREFDRRKTEEALNAFTGVQARAPVDPRTRLCLHCGSHRPIESQDIQSINEDSEEGEDDDDDDISELHSHSPSAHKAKGKSPYMHPLPSHSTAKLMSASRSTLMLKAHGPESASPPASPQSPNMSSFFKMPQAWASSVTLSLTTAIGHGHNAHNGDKNNAPTSSPGKSLKRRESFGVKRLFGSLKGKERERDHGRSQTVPGTTMGSTANLSSSTLSSDSSSASEHAVEGWEVVGEEESVNPSAHSTAPTSPARSIPERSATSPTGSVSSPTSENAHPAFLNRPVRQRPVTLDPDTPLTPISSLPAPATPKTIASPLATPFVAAATRPFLPEKSPLRTLANTQQLRQVQARIQTQATISVSPPTPSSPFPTVTATVAPTIPSTPRSSRPCPSVTWKVPSPATRSPLSKTPAQPTSGVSTPIQSPVQSPVRSPVHSPVHSPVPSPTPAPTPLPRIVTAATATHPAVAALVRSEMSALRHQSAPLPPRTPTEAPENTIPSPISQSSSLAPTDGQVHLRRRPAVTPPSSHRRAIHSLDCSPVLEGAQSPFTSWSPTVPLDFNEDSESEAEASDEEPESMSIVQLLAADEERAISRRPSAPAVPAPALALAPTTPATTPTTPTFPAGIGASPSLSSHFLGRPLPQPPVEPEVSVKRVPDGYSVNRMPEANYGRTTAASTPVRVPLLLSPPSPVTPQRHVPPPPAPPASAPAPPSAAPRARVPPEFLASPWPVVIERSESGGSVLEDVAAAEEGPRPEFLQITDLDVLASRAFDGPADGRNYEVRASPLSVSERANVHPFLTPGAFVGSAARIGGPGVRSARRRSAEEGAGAFHGQGGGDAAPCAQGRPGETQDVALGRARGPLWGVSVPVQARRARGPRTGVQACVSVSLLLPDSRRVGRTSPGQFGSAWTDVVPGYVGKRSWLRLRSCALMFAGDRRTSADASFAQVPRGMPPPLAGHRVRVSHVPHGTDV